jgi:RND family efflux transporter MFP subunit
MIMSQGSADPQHPKAAKARRLLMTGGFIAIVIATTATIGISNRARGIQEIARWTEEQAIPTVAVVTPRAALGPGELVLPGNVDAFYTGSIFARASGYVMEWYEDIGAHVKKGQVLALIDTPELDQQLAQARADLATAQANQALASVTAGRWEALAKRDVVSQQARDEKASDLQAKTAATQALQANVARLESLQAFNRLVAPFDGVVTSRGVDIGHLVTAGGNAGKPLFTVSDTHRMRVYVSVPQAFLGELKPGLKASLMLPQYPGRTFEGELVTTSNSVATDSRAALVELHADNPDGKLWPGSFAEVHFHLDQKENVLRLPATALFFGSRGIEVALLTSEGRVNLSKVELGRNLGSEVEVLSGVSAEDTVIDSPPESLTTGQLVSVAERPQQRDAYSKRAAPSRRGAAPN